MAAQPIYLDNNSTTPVDPRVRDAMLPTLGEHFGNPSSATHGYGWYAEEMVKIAREQVAELIKGKPEEVLFTSGATESNSLALCGVIKALRRRGAPLRIVSATTEHRAILDALEDLKLDGVEVELLPVQSDGRVALETIRRALSRPASLLSLMIANNEVGALHDVAAASKIAREANVLTHTDATQAAGKIPLDVKALGVDLLSLSGHKIYGPKGVGALWVRKTNPKVPIAPLQLGGGQERGLRGGTLNVPGIVGLGKAAELASAECEQEAERLSSLASQFLSALQNQGIPVELNGPREGRLPGNLNFAIPGITSARLIAALNAKIAFSATSACSSRSGTPSHVLKAMGLDEQRQRESVRFGIGRFNTAEEVARAAAAVADAATALRTEGK